MDDFGQYFKYIVIGLILAFRFFIRGKRKEQNPNQAPRRNKKPRKPVTTTPSLDEILRELSGESKQQNKPVPSAAPAGQKPTTERAKVAIENHQTEARTEYEHQADTGPDLEEVRQEILEIQNLQEASSEQITFDARQAIIAETILNRPEY